ncbi:hypothetical protein NEIELOOT_02250 [Neisseria elongata subsp. glycolytica ATCC 29315]|uniref:Uncharacterized protein n=1 Tax=Neisseria elongata subsp. glycolytica ATCC 29315 TaxID=546263 RepID=D4DT49_NEIEG|nr:hypothetical protein NEIELOOT_02250 [Neisseria elongata subsp. glycolytica ATCC 29315]
MRCEPAVRHSPALLRYMRPPVCGLSAGSDSNFIPTSSEAV